MDFDLISALFSACLGSIAPGIEEMGKDTAAYLAADAAVMDALGGLKLPQGVDSDITELVADAEYEARRCGFINGFQLGVRLMAEVYGNDKKKEEAACSM